MIEDEWARDYRPEQVECAMELRGRSVADLAQSAGVPMTLLWRVLRGERVVEDAKFWDVLAEHLDCRWKGDTLLTIPKRRSDRLIEWEGAA